MSNILNFCYSLKHFNKKEYNQSEQHLLLILQNTNNKQLSIFATNKLIKIYEITNNINAIYELSLFYMKLKNYDQSKFYYFMAYNKRQDKNDYYILKILNTCFEHFIYTSHINNLTYLNKNNKNFHNIQIFCEIAVNNNHKDIFYNIAQLYIEYTKNSQRRLVNICRLFEDVIFIKSSDYYTQKIIDYCVKDIEIYKNIRCFYLLKLYFDKDPINYNDWTFNERIYDPGKIKFYKALINLKIKNIDFIANHIEILQKTDEVKFLLLYENKQIHYDYNKLQIVETQQEINNMLLNFHLNFNITKINLINKLCCICFNTSNLLELFCQKQDNQDHIVCQKCLSQIFKCPICRCLIKK